MANEVDQYFLCIYRGHFKKNTTVKKLLVDLKMRQHKWSLDDYLQKEFKLYTCTPSKYIPPSLFLPCESVKMYSVKNLISLGFSSVYMHFRTILRFHIVDITISWIHEHKMYCKSLDFYHDSVDILSIFLFPCMYLSVCLSVYLLVSIYLSLSVHLFICLCLSVCLYVCLSACLSACLSVS